jgi:hypothetical protein
VRNESKDRALQPVPETREDHAAGEASDSTASPLSTHGHSWGGIQMNELTTTVAEQVVEEQGTSGASASSGQPYPHEYALRRVDNPNRSTHGWKVQLVRHRKAYARYFSDAQYGGSGQARQAAIEWRDRFDIEVPRLSRAGKADILRSNNTSGVPGVFPWQYKDKKGRIHRYWVAVWKPEPGQKHKSRKFSIARYGEEDAKARAIQARQEAMAIQAEEPYVPQVKYKPKPLRPPRTGRSRIVAELDNEQMEWLTALAVERGVSRSDLLNLSIAHIRTDTDQAAIDYRAALLHKLPMANFAVEWRNAKRSRNKSGIVGVCRLGREEGCQYWMAQWTDADGKKQSKRFAIHRLGEEQAKAMACQAREAAMKEVAAALAARPKDG